MKFLFGLLALLCLELTWVHSESAAVEQCRTLYHVDVDPQSTFTNSKCTLVCYLQGKPISNRLNEGRPCPALGDSRDHVCESGACVKTALKVGHIDVEVTSAHLPAPYNAYSTVCIQNGTAVKQLPIQDRSKCTSKCSSKQVLSAHPVWTGVCANNSGLNKSLFTSDSRVTIEVWNHKTTGDKVFLGGASMTITQLLALGDSHRPVTMNLVKGPSSGTVTTIITWTPGN